MFASIPSPSSGSVEIGPLTFRAYGLMIALGVLAAVWLAGRRFVERGHDADHATGMAMWAVPAGLVGARLYHVITDWRSFEGRWLDALKIWEGGLGILGGIMLGAVAGLEYGRRHGISTTTTFDVIAPTLPLAQAIGRWGNWFNQELFGRPTDVPWALEIDADHRPTEHLDQATFHPTFLYESLWNLALVGVLVRVDRSRRLAPGGLFALYLAGYSVGRLWIEALRIDTATELAGLRVNLWVFALLLIASLVAVIRSLRAGGAPDGADLSDGDVEDPDGTADLSDGDVEDPDGTADLSDGDAEDLDDLHDRTALHEVEVSPGDTDDRADVD